MIFTLYSVILCWRHVLGALQRVHVLEVKSEDKPKKKKGKATLEDFKEEFPKILQEFYTSRGLDCSVFVCSKIHLF